MYKLKTLSVLVAAIAFAGCEAGIQDGGDPALSTMNGLAVDGRVANGKVWADRDNDGAIDDFEPFAWTDQYGYYTYRPAKDGSYEAKDYCAAGATEDDLKHCLRYGASTDNVTIRIRGGIDLDTGEKLKGTMAMESSISESSSAANRAAPKVLSPLTTMLAAVPPAQKEAMRMALGITDANEAEILKKDYSDASDSDARALYAKALAVQTILDVAFSAGDSDSTKQLAALGKLAEKIAEKGGVSELVGTDLEDVLESAGVPADKKGKISKRLNSVNQVVAAIASAGSPEEVKRSIKSVEVVSKLVKKEADGETVNALGSEDSDTISKVIRAVTQALTPDEGDDEADIDITSVTNAVINIDLSSYDPDDENATNPLEDAVTDNKLAGEITWAGQLFILRPDSELYADVSDKDYVAVYLEGADNATSGKLNICASVDPLEDLDEEAPSLDKTYFGGTWSRIGPASISLIIDWNGQEFNGQVKALANSRDQSLYAGTADGETVVAMTTYRMTSDLVEGESATLVRDKGDAYTEYTSPNILASVFSSKTDQTCVNIDGDIRSKLGNHISAE